MVRCGAASLAGSPRAAWPGLRISVALRRQPGRQHWRRIALISAGVAARQSNFSAGMIIPIERYRLWRWHTRAALDNRRAVELDLSQARRTQAGARHYTGYGVAEAADVAAGVSGGHENSCAGGIDLIARFCQNLVYMPTKRPRIITYKRPADQPPGGRPKGVRMPCGWGCGANLTASEIRGHFTGCARRPKESSK